MLKLLRATLKMENVIEICELALFSTSMWLFQLVELSIGTAPISPWREEIQRGVFTFCDESYFTL